MRRTATYHRRSPSTPNETSPQPPQKTQIETHHQKTLTGTSFPMLTKPLIWISALVGIAALLYTLTRSTNAQNVCYQISQFSGQMAAIIWACVKAAHWSFCYPFQTIQATFWALVAYLHGGVFFAVFWLSTVYTPFHYWVMDTLKGEEAESLGKLCGNKFMKCPPWD